MLTTTLPPKRKPTRAELLAYIPGATPPPKLSVVAVPDLATDWDAFTKALAARPIPEVTQTKKLPAFVREVLDPEKVAEFKSICDTWAKLNGEMESLSPLKIQDECERQRAAFQADPKSANQPEAREAIELRWRISRQAKMRQFFQDHGAAFGATLKPLVKSARDVVRKRIREYMATEDAAADSMGCPPPSPNWYVKNLIKMENALDNDLTVIDDFLVELARFKNGDLPVEV